MRSSLRITTALVVLFLGANCGSAASESSTLVQRALNDYIEDSNLTACNYSLSELKQIKRSIPKSVESYAPEFATTIGRAIAAHKAGDCSIDSPRKNKTSEELPKVAVKDSIPEAPQPDAVTDTESDEPEAPLPAQQQLPTPPAATTQSVTQPTDENTAGSSQIEVWLLAGAGLLLLIVAVSIHLLKTRSEIPINAFDHLRTAWPENGKFWLKWTQKRRNQR